MTSIEFTAPRASTPIAAAEQSADYLREIHHIETGRPASGYCSRTQSVYEATLDTLYRNREWAIVSGVPHYEGLVQPLTTLNSRLLEVKATDNAAEQQARWQDIMNEDTTYWKTLVSTPYTDDHLDDVISSIIASAYEQMDNPPQGGSNQVRFEQVITKTVNHRAWTQEKPPTIEEIFAYQLKAERQLEYRGAEPFNLSLSDVPTETLATIARFREMRDELYHALYDGSPVTRELSLLLSSRIDRHIAAVSDQLEKDTQKLLEQEDLARLTDGDIEQQAKTRADEAREAVMQKARAHMAINLALLQDAARLGAEYEGVDIRL